jgi:hypothetical protein
VQIIRSCAARCSELKRALTSDSIKDELAKQPAAAALQIAEQLMEWRKLTSVYKAIMEGETEVAATQKNTPGSPKRA